MNGRRRTSILPVWLLLLALVPLVAGGVVVGDEAALLSLARGWDALQIGLREFFLRAPYAFHHMPWFLTIYGTQKVVGFFTSSGLITEAVISMETVAAGLSACALVYTWLVRRRAMAGATAVLVMLGFFFGGYGLFVAWMGQTAECYMALLMAARLFAAEPGGERRRAAMLGLIDGALIVFKLYSIVFVLLMLPLFWRQSDRGQRFVYGGALMGIVALLVLGKFLAWNPPVAYVSDMNIHLPAMLGRFAQQLVSPWTGLVFCMPLLLVLFFVPRVLRGGLLVKFAALTGCLAFFSLYLFFDADHPGGRYIFPFLIVLVPEVAAAVEALIARWRPAVFAVPMLLLIFLPVGNIGLPFFPGESMRTRDPDVPADQRCLPDHPALYAWKMAAGHVSGSRQVQVCLRGRNRLLDPADGGIPRTGPGRVAFILAGGMPHDYEGGVGPHRAMAAHLRETLLRFHLGSIRLWQFLTLLPALLLLGWSLAVAAVIARRRPLA